MTLNIQGKYSGFDINTKELVQTPYVKKQGLSKDAFQTEGKSKRFFNASFNTEIPISNRYSSKQLLKAYTNAGFIKGLIDKNSDLKQIISDNGLDGKIYPSNISDITNTHLTSTAAVALQLANKMGVSVSDRQILEQACYFHDFGKVLVPPEIVNKPGALTEEEHNLMQLHSELGYELLSNAGMNKRVLNLIKNHHMPLEVNNDILGQILSVADIYSALREQRSYKKPLTEKESISILDQKAQNGEVSTEVVNTLKTIIVNSLAA